MYLEYDDIDDDGDDEMYGTRDSLNIARLLAAFLIEKFCPLDS